MDNVPTDCSVIDRAEGAVGVSSSATPSFFSLEQAQLPEINTQRRFEQFMTSRTEKIEEVLDSLDLKDRIVIEVGVGEGAITRQLLARGARVIGYEIDPAITPESIRSQITFIARDFNEADFDYIESCVPPPMLISNPPYTQLTAIREKIIERHNVRDYVLFIPAVYRMHFPESRVLACQDGNDFRPAASGQHLIVRSDSSCTEESPLTNHEPITWQRLADSVNRFTELPETERAIIQQLLGRAALRLDSKRSQHPGLPSAFIVTEDSDKLDWIQKNLLKDKINLARAELYSHPEYLKELLSVPGISFVVRAESINKNTHHDPSNNQHRYRFTVFTLQDGVLRSDGEIPNS